MRLPRPRQLASRQQDSRSLSGVALAAVVAALMLTLLLEALDQTVVGTAMPRIIAQLHGLDRYTWVVTTYLLASTVVIPLVGKLSDLHGRKGYLLAGTALFLAGSALCGSARTIDQLILFRAVQGLGGGIGIALVFTVVGDLFPPKDRGRWQGVVGSVYLISAVLGPTLGGWLADYGPRVGTLITAASRWRWVFYINLPLGLLALGGLAAYLPGDLSPHQLSRRGWDALRRIDLAGVVLVGAATLALLFGLTWAEAGFAAWRTPPVTGALALAGVLAPGILLVERRAIEPVIPLTLYRNRVYAADALLSFLVMMALLGMATYTPLYIQDVIGLTAAQSGTLMTPFSLGIALSSSLTGLAISALRRYQAPAVLGAFLMSVGIFGLTRMTPRIAPLEIALLVTLTGLGMGALFSVVTVVSQNAALPEQLGVATALARYTGQLGGVVGVTFVGMVVNLTLASELHREVAVAQLTRADRLPLAAAIQHGLVAVLICCAVAIVVAFRLQDLHLRPPAPTEKSHLWRHQRRPSQPCLLPRLVFAITSPR